MTVLAGSSAGRTQLQPPFYSFSLGHAPSGRVVVVVGVVGGRGGEGRGGGSACLGVGGTEGEPIHLEIIRR